MNDTLIDALPDRLEALAVQINSHGDSDLLMEAAAVCRRVFQAAAALGPMLDADMKVIARALDASEDDETAMQALVNVQHGILVARKRLVRDE